MKRLRRLWDALEDRPRLRGVRRELQDSLRSEFEVAAGFLRPTGEEAKRYPCPTPSGIGCPRWVIPEVDGSFRAVCGSAPKECETVHLSRDAVQILGFDGERFVRCLQRLLGVSAVSSKLDADGDIIRLGSISVASGRRLPVILLMGHSSQATEALTARIERTYRQGGVLLTPTERLIDPETEGRLIGEGFTWLVLADLLSADSTKLIATQKLADAVLSGGKSRPARASHPASQRRRRGFAPNAEDHQKVVEAVAQVGDGWSSHLDEVCRQLQIVAAAFPKSLRKEGFDSWDELAEDILGPGNSSGRERVTKYIEYRMDWVRRNQPSRESLAKVSR